MLASNAQKKMIYGLSKKMGLDDDGLHAFIYNTTGHEHISQMQISDAKIAIDKMVVLPENIRELIDNRLRELQPTYSQIAEEVQGLGYDISRSSIGRLAVARNKYNQALSMRLAISTEQAKVAAGFAKGDTTAYAKGVLNIVLTELTNRILATTSEEYDDLELDKVLEVISRLIKDMTNLAKFEFNIDKGKTAAMDEVEQQLNKYMADDPEFKAEIIEKIGRLSA